MINETEKEDFTHISAAKMQKIIINDSENKVKSLIDTNTNHSSASIIELFIFLSSNLKDDDYENAEKNLINILEEIGNGIDTYITNNLFEPLLIILDNFSDFSPSAIYIVLQIIYNLMIIPDQIEYFHFFSQPIFLEHYFELITLYDQSVNIISEIIRIKNQIPEEYEDQILLIIEQSPLSSPLIDLLNKCIRVDPEFVPIDQISLKIDEILKSEADESLFCSAAELVHLLIKFSEDVIDFFSENAIFYLKLDNITDDISLLKIYIDIVKMTKDFSFLFIDQDCIFADFILFVLNSCNSNELLLSLLLRLLSYEGNMSCFLEHPQILTTCIERINSFSFKDQKKLLIFVLNSVIQGNNQILQQVIEAGLINFLSIFMENLSDSRLTMKILNVIGLICENIQISMPTEIFDCVELLMNSTNEEIATLASAVDVKINQNVEINEN